MSKKNKKSRVKVITYLFPFLSNKTLTSFLKSYIKKNSNCIYIFTKNKKSKTIPKKKGVKPDARDL